MTTDIQTLTKSFDAFAGTAEDALKKLADQNKDLGDRLFQIEKRGQLVPGLHGTGPITGTLAGEGGELKRITSAPEFAALLERRSKDAAFNIKAGALLERKNSIINSGDTFAPATRLPGIVAAPHRRTWLRDRMPMLQAASANVEFVRQSVFSNAAAPQGATSSPLQFENETKPESSITFTLEDAKVPTIAHWLRASRQVLADSAALQNFLQTQLLYGLEVELEDQILNGTGTGANMSGLVTNATAYNRGATGDTRIDTLRKAVTQLEVSEFVPDVMILNPADAEAIDLLKDGELRYLIGQPAGAGASALWSTPVHKTNAMPAGTFLVGELQRAAAFWTREDARLEMSSHDSDNFTKNMVTILAELRATVTVFLPAGLVTGSF